MAAAICPATTSGNITDTPIFGTAKMVLQTKNTPSSPPVQIHHGPPRSKSAEATDPPPATQ